MCMREGQCTISAYTSAEIEKEQLQYLKNGKIEDLSWKKKPTRCFVSSCDMSRLRFGATF